MKTKYHKQLDKTKLDCHSRNTKVFNMDKTKTQAHYTICRYIKHKKHLFNVFHN
jgi:hypothetical protein